MTSVEIVKFFSKGGLFPHTHQLDLPISKVLNPPAEGLELETSTEYSLVFKHKHKVFLNPLDLKMIADGKTIVVHDTDKGRHSFEISLSK